MFTQFLLAVRNVRRNKSRSGLTLGAIGFGVMMTLFLGGFAQGFVNMLVADTVQCRTGALQIHRAGYFDVRHNQPIDLDMEQGGALEQRIRSVAGVKDVTPRIVFAGLLNSGSMATHAVFTAMDPASSPRVLPLARDEIQGIDVGVKASSIVLGADLARSMGVLVPKPGGVKQGASPAAGDGDAQEELRSDAVVAIQSAHRDGRQNALDAVVGGTLDNGIPFESKRVAYVPLDWAQNLLGMQGRVTEYAIAVNNIDELDQVANALRTALGADYEVQTWRELRPNVNDVNHVIQAVLTGVCMIFLIIAIFGVANTMLMSVLERTREIGTMMAVGVKRGQVLAMFVLEAAVLAMTGGTAGGIVGATIVKTIAAAGGIHQHPPGSKAIKHIVPVVSTELLLAACIATLAGAVFASIYPAWRASRLRPVEALRAV